MKRFLSKENLPVMATVLVCVLLYLGAGLKFPGFFSTRVPMNLLSDNAFLGVVAVGLTFVILSGGIDLSVGSLVGLSGILIAHLTTHAGWHPALAIGATLLVGITVGWVQGVLIAKFEIAPFLATLGGLFFCRGVALWISQESITIEHPFFKQLALFTIPVSGGASVTVGTLAFLVVVTIAIWMGRHTLFGRTVYAIGGNKASAKLMGLEVDKTLLSVYALSGFCSALGGVLYSIYTSSGNAVAGTGMELDAIAAVVIGGTLLSGGYGSVFGSFVGVLILGIIQTGISYQGTLSSWWTRIAIGILLLVFMLLQRGLVRLSGASKNSSG